MVILALTIPLMVLGLAIAIGPLVLALVREHRVATAAESERLAVSGLETTSTEVAPEAIDAVQTDAAEAAPERTLVNA